MEKAKYILYNGRFYIINEEKTYVWEHCRNVRPIKTM